MDPDSAGGLVIMGCSDNEQVPPEIAEQVAQVYRVIERHLAPVLHSIHLYGSAVDGGLKPYSDIDLLVTVNRQLDEGSRRNLQHGLLAVSAPPGESSARRALEVTVVAHDELIPWCYPPRRELQFGEWLRDDLLAGIHESAMPDHDLAILITKIRQNSVALMGPLAADLFDAVPKADFHAALSDTIAQWRDETDWQGDERNIMLALARIWYSASTGQIAAKQDAAEWAMERLPGRHRAVLDVARRAHLGGDADVAAVPAEAVKAFINHAKREIERLLSGA